MTLAKKTINDKRKKLFEKYRPKQELMKKKFLEAKNIKERMEIATEMSRIPRNSRMCRIAKRCTITNRSRGLMYSNIYGITRYVFRILARKGELPGIVKDR